MRCKAWHGLIAGYVAGDLSRWRARRLEGHMAQCAECRGALAAMREMRTELRGAYSQPSADVLREVREGVLAAVAEEAPVNRARRSWRPVWAAACVTAVIAGAAGYAWRNSDQAPAPTARHEIASPQQTLALDTDATAAKSPPSEREPTFELLGKLGANSEQVALRIDTGDPGIDIIWLIPTRGD